MGRKADRTAIARRCDLSDPTAVLRAFMAEMNAWERRARAAVDAYQGTKEGVPKMRPFWTELAGIFDRYCIPQGDRRGPGQYRSVGMAPTYDPEGEEVLEVVPRPRGRIKISTRRTDPKASPREFVYLLERDGDRWRLARKQWLDHQGKPRGDYL